METILFVLLLLLFIIYVVTVSLGVSLFLRMDDRIRKMEILMGESQDNLREKISSGLIQGIEDIKSSDKKYLEFVELSRRKQIEGLPIMKNDDSMKKFDSGGDLIPANATSEERKVLEMFYDQKE